MPITIKQNTFKYRNPDTGDYDGVDVLAETTVDELIADIEEAAEDQIDAIEAKGEEVIESIPSDYSELADQVDDLKTDFGDVADFVGDTDTDIGTHIGPVEKLAFTDSDATQKTVSIKVRSNNSIKVYGTATEQFIRTIQDNISLTAGTYTFSIDSAITSSGYEIQLYNISTSSVESSITKTSTTTSRTVTVSETTSFRIRIKCPASSPVDDTQIVSIITQGTVDNTLAYATAKLISDVADLADDVDDAKAIIGDTIIGTHIETVEKLAFTDGDYTQQTVSIKVRANNSIQVSGTATATFLRTIQDNISVPAGTYIFSVDSPILSSGYEIQLFNVTAGSVAGSITYTSETLVRTITINATTTFRIRILVNSGTVASDTQVVSFHIDSAINNTLSWISADLMPKVADLRDMVKQKCKLIENSGHVFTADALSIAGTNVSIKNDKSTIFAETAKRITASANSASVKISLGANYSFDTVTVVFYFPYDSYASASATSCYLWIYANGTSHTPIVSSSNCCWGWNYLKIPRSKLGLGDTTTISSVDIVFKTTDGTTESEFGEIIVDSIILDMKMKPTFVLDLDQIWEKSINNGAYDYCRSNNIPYTVHTWQYDSRDSTTVTEIKKAMINGCEFSYYGGYTNESALHNATNYSDALDECVLMENDIIPFTHRRFLTYGCSAHTMTQYLRESLEASGVKAIRGRWIQNPIGYFSEYSTWLPYSIEISQENSTLQQIKDHIDEAVTNGSCVVAFTHGVCNNDESVVGTSSSAIRITTFQDMIDYLVDLRDQGKIQICTMEQFVNQCIG